MNFSDLYVENAPPEASGGQASLVLHSYYFYYYLIVSSKARPRVPFQNGSHPYTAHPKRWRAPATAALPMKMEIKKTPVPRKSRCAARGPGREGAPQWSARARRRRRVGPPEHIEGRSCTMGPRRCPEARRNACAPNHIISCAAGHREPNGVENVI